MELSNSLISVSPVPDKLNKPSQDSASQQNNTVDRVIESRPQPVKRLASPEDLERRSNELEQNRVQRLDASDSAPLRAQQALSTYQQTEEAGRAYVEGELVGLDLFV